MKTLFERMAEIARGKPQPTPTGSSHDGLRYRGIRERRTFCPEDGHACYTPDGDEPKGWRCANYDLCKSFERL